MLIALHRPSQTEPCAALRRLCRRICGRALPLFGARNCAEGCSADDWRQIEDELTFRDLRYDADPKIAVAGGRVPKPATGDRDGGRAIAASRSKRAQLPLIRSRRGTATRG